MRIEAPPARQRDLDDSLIPLINVVFLMLIFFMLAGHISAPDVLPVEPPESRSAVSTEPDVGTLLVGLDGQIALDGEILSSGILSLPSELLVADAPPLRIKTDAALPMASLQRVLQQLRQAGVTQVELLTLPAGEP